MTMAKKRKVRLVKFYHPGTEHCPGKNCKPVAHVGWNRGPHHRKFIQTSGSYVDGNNKEKYSETLLFWGEWEPDTKLIECYKNEPARYLYEPLFLIPSCLPNPSSGKKIAQCGKLPKNLCSVGGHYQNTDPFVFADNLYYSLCKQRSYKELRCLPPGCVILFGAYKRTDDGQDAFALDTVFVVGESRPFNKKNYAKKLNGFVPDDYFCIMRYAENAANGKYVCYKGVAFDKNKPDEMFSFVPCRERDEQIRNEGKVPFERLLITEADGINELKEFSQRQGICYASYDALKAKEVWQKIRDLAIKKGYKLGIRFKYKKSNNLTLLRQTNPNSCFAFCPSSRH